MSLSSRGELPRFNEGVPSLDDDGRGLGGLLERDPSSYQYKSSLKSESIPPGKVARRLYNYMVAAQTRRYGDTLSVREGAENSIHRNTGAALKMIERTLNTYSVDQIERAIDLACFRSEWPFTFKFVNKVLKSYGDAR